MLGGEEAEEEESVESTLDEIVLHILPVRTPRIVMPAKTVIRITARTIAYSMDVAALSLQKNLAIRCITISSLTGDANWGGISRCEYCLAPSVATLPRDRGLSNTTTSGGVAMIRSRCPVSRAIETVLANAWLC